MKRTLPGQLDMPAMPERKNKWSQTMDIIRAKELRDRPEQKPCDIGLFSDESSQIDLIEMLMEPHD